jgi:uncharacterized protein YnzC (UPF0291/DUF896 family)
MKVNLENLPEELLKENAVRLEIEQGVLIFRATEKIRNRIAELLEKEKNSTITEKEREEFNAYEEIDDYLSHVNRLIRNSVISPEVNIAA